MIEAGLMKITKDLQNKSIAMEISARFRQYRIEAFHGVPGLFADSLPDRFGNAVIDEWLLRQGRSPESFTAIERKL